MLIGRFPLSPPSRRLGASPWRRGRAGTPGLGPVGCRLQRQRRGEGEGRRRVDRSWWSEAGGRSPPRPAQSAGGEPEPRAPNPVALNRGSGAADPGGGWRRRAGRCGRAPWSGPRGPRGARDFPGCEDAAPPPRSTRPPQLRTAEQGPAAHPERERAACHGSQGPQEDPVLRAGAAEPARPPPGGDGKGPRPIRVARPPHPRTYIPTYGPRLDPAWAAAGAPHGKFAGGSG